MYRPEETQAEFVDPQYGRKMRSIVRVAKAGHLLMYEDARKPAMVLRGILHEYYARPMPHMSGQKYILSLATSSVAHVNEILVGE